MGRPRIAVLVLALLAAVAFGVAVGVGTFRVTTVDAAIVAVGLAGMVGAAAGLLAVQRFEWFIIGVFALRSSLDAFAGRALGGLDPSAALGAMVLILGVIWLLVQWRSGLWHPPSRVTYALLLLAAAGAVSALGSAHRFVAFGSAIEVLAGGVVFAVLEQLLARRPGMVRSVIVALLLSLVIPAVTAYAQIAGGGTKVDSTGLSRVLGTFAHPNPFATYLVLVIVLSLGMALVSTDRLRVASVLALTAAVPLLLSTYTRVGWLAGFVGVAYLGLRHSRRVLGFLGLGIVAVTLAVPSVVTRLSDLTSEAKYDDTPANSLAWRLEYWSDLVPLAGESPVTGIGLDTVQETTIEGLRPHNVWIQTYVETGLVGLFALGWVVVSLWQMLAERRRRARTPHAAVLASVAVAAALTLLIQSFTENLTTSTIIWWYAAAVMTFGAPNGASDDELGFGDPRTGWREQLRGLPRPVEDQLDPKRRPDGVAVRPRRLASRRRIHLPR